MEFKKSKIQHIKDIDGVDYIYITEYNDLQTCKDIQYDYKMQGIKTRRVKTEYNTYRLYIRGADID